MLHITLHYIAFTLHALCVVVGTVVLQCSAEMCTCIIVHAIQTHLRMSIAMGSTVAL
jgi:hypothetical protein